jgi:tetratricopeptide (TPR) repeat protein
MSVPAISVLMSVYNGEAYLAEAVDSILGQSFRDFEFVIINDGSTDGTGPLLKKYAAQDSRIVLIEQENTGLVGALNRGLAAARAPYIARMDADDIALPDRLARQYEYLEKHPDIAVLGAAITLIDQDNQRIRDIAYPQGDAEISAFIKKGSPLAHPVVMMRTDIIRALGGYRAAYRHAEDYDLWLRVFEHHRLDNLPALLLRYRQHDNKVGVRHATQQGLATTVARVTHRLRASGRPDPTASMTALDPNTISRQLGLTPDEEAVFNLEVLNVMHAALVSAENWAELDGHFDRLARLPIPAQSKPVVAAMYLRTASLYARQRRFLPCLKLGLTALKWDFSSTLRAMSEKIIVIGFVRIRLAHFKAAYKR